MSHFANLRMWAVWGWAGLVIAGSGGLGCTQSSATSQPSAGDTESTGDTTVKLTVTSSAFAAGERIPVKHTGEGADLSPPLAWSGAPSATAEFALIMDDPDAPGQTWVHWVLYRIPNGTTALQEGIPTTETLGDPAGALQGKNSSNTIGYQGPMPPPGHGTHHYHFKVYALDKTVTLSAGATKQQLLGALQGHILAEGELIGTYSR